MDYGQSVGLTGIGHGIAVLWSAGEYRMEWGPVSIGVLGI